MTDRQYKSERRETFQRERGKANLSSSLLLCSYCYCRRMRSYSELARHFHESCKKCRKGGNVECVTKSGNLKPRFRWQNDFETDVTHQRGSCDTSYVLFCSSEGLFSPFTVTTVVQVATCWLYIYIQQVTSLDCG